MVLHHHQLKGSGDADAIPILSADDPPLLYHREHEHDDPADIVHVYPQRRNKRHSGNSEASASSSSLGGSSVARFVRRRGRSVPCDTSGGLNGSYDSNGSSNNSNSNGNEYDDDGAQVSRTRAASAGSALAGSRAARSVSDGAQAAAGRRRAASSILNHFRRRHKENAASYEYESQQQQQGNSVRRRKVHFKTTLHAEVMPNPFAQHPSYDELLFNVGGLYQTLSFLHDPYPSEDPSGTNSSTDSSSHGFDDDLVQPLERSMQLMIAEFLFRSAVYLGYPNDSKPWIPGFRETKRYSVNDVKRWRRLAHHDWEKEEQQFEASVALYYHHHGGSSQSSQSHQHRRKSAGIRAAVSGWLQRRRRHSAPAKIVSLSCPPPVPASTDLSLLVTIANSCVYCGAFQFTARDLLVLCNVDIETKVTAAAASGAGPVNATFMDA